VSIICIERVIVAVADLDAARERWSRAGFAVAPPRAANGGLRVAPMGAGAIEIDLCAPANGAGNAPASLAAALARGGGVAGWTWGVSDRESSDSDNPIALSTSFLPGVWTASVAANADSIARRENLVRICGSNPNTVDYLEHIVVMTPSLEDAIAAHEKIGLPCKRIREAGRGMRQAFFKLEQTALEIVGPATGVSQVWGLAFMCRDIARAVAIVRGNDLQATEPKAAIQGGKIARIVDPLDGVAIAFMQS
jgi:predicted enzyme related to lactoylglutathione lyase